MNLGDLGSIGEFIGALGVIASLVYLAIQIRQNNLLVRASTAQSIATVIHQNLASQLQPGMADILVKGSLDPDCLQPAEQFMFFSALSQTGRTWQAIYQQYRLGTIDEGEWNGFVNAMRHRFALPGFQRWWAISSTYHAPWFREFVDEEILAKLPSGSA